MGMSGMLFLWCLLVTFESVHSLTLTAYHQCLDLGALNPSDVSTLNTIGLQQCMRECLGDRSCLSLNYWRDDLRCTHHRVKTGGPYGLVPDSDCIYIVRQDLPMVSVYVLFQRFVLNALNIYKLKIIESDTISFFCSSVLSLYQTIYSILKLFLSSFQN